MPNEEFEREIVALEEERAFLDLEGWDLTEVRGADACAWLNDLITANVERLEPGRSVRSLLLSPTGRIRADFHALRRSTDPSYLLLQPPGQPASLTALLGPYVLSSDVELSSGRGPLIVMPCPDREWFVSETLPTGRWVKAGPRAFDAWRIRHGIARFPVDLDEESLPAEAGLDREPLVDRDKGCYLGQESVAKVRNLGHPARVVVPASVDGPASAGDVVHSGSKTVGLVTSVDGSRGILRIHWGARASELATEAGTTVRPSYPPS